MTDYYMMIVVLLIIFVLNVIIKSQ